MKMFVDLDETLVKSMDYWQNKNAIKVAFSDKGWFGCIVKNGAIDFVKKLQNRFGVENVYLFSAGMHDYVQLVNEHALQSVFGNRIIGRYWNENWPFTENEKFDSVLIDNSPLTHEYTMLKIEFLRRHGSAKLILAKEFHGHLTSKFTDKHFQDILVQI